MTPPAVVIRPALKAFVAQLHEVRLRVGISKLELVKRAGMTRQGLLKIEKGGNVTLGTIILLADALGCEIADFFPRKSPSNN